MNELTGSQDNHCIDTRNIYSLVRRELDCDHVSQEEPESPPLKLAGLAFSGGGIRSASFTLGVAQALKETPITPDSSDCVFSKLHYLSTVSGGGYTGSALTWAAQNKPKDKSCRPLSVFEFIRQNADYLIPTERLNSSSLVGVILRTLFLSLLVYVPFLIFLFFGLNHFNLYDGVDVLPTSFAGASNWYTNLSLKPNWISMFSIGVLILMIVLSILYSLLTFFNSVAGKWNKLKPYQFRIWLQKTLGTLLVIALFGFFIASMRNLDELIESTGVVDGGLASIFSVLAGMYSAYNNFQEQIQCKNQDTGRGTAIIAIVAAGLMVTGLFLGAYIIATKLSGNPMVVFTLLAVALVLGSMVNLNNVSLHRMYRDRLMEAFMPNKNFTSLDWQPATEANAFKLSNIETQPYHILNTNIVLTDSKDSKYRGRGGDNFILSPKVCGSDATGHCPTKSFINDRMTLASSMAISGAAVNPHAGAAGQGPTRNKLVSFLMALLNIRLGFWAANPTNRPWSSISNYFSPGLKGLLGMGFSEHKKWIELTDGGHFENTGVYELIRRRLSLIIMTDGGADPDYLFQDLGNLVEKVRVDFGARIKFRTTKGGFSTLEQLVPKEVEGISYPLADQGFAIADIYYSSHSQQENAKPLNETGLLILIKPTLVTGLAQDIYSYKLNNPKFPQQPTSDQFFDEPQFEAYRELGRQITEQLIHHESGDLERALNKGTVLPPSDS